MVSKSHVPKYQYSKQDNLIYFNYYNFDIISKALSQIITFSIDK